MWTSLVLVPSILPSDDSVLSKSQEQWSIYQSPNSFVFNVKAAVGVILGVVSHVFGCILCRSLIACGKDSVAFGGTLQRKCYNV